MKDITVVLFTYNSSIERVLLSLKSIVLQKDVSFDLIISDDGSDNNYFKEIKKYLDDYNFKNYELIGREKNIGTVKNYYEVSKRINTQYFKDLGQGDMFYDEHSLRNIVNEIKKEKPTVLFTNATYYYLKNGKFCSFKNYRYPQSLKPYIKNNTNKIRRNYILYDDIILGSTFTYKTDKALEYFTLLKDVAKYAEDNAVRLMAMNGEKIIFLNKSAILYECGQGISTSQNIEFENMLKKDWDNTSSIIEKYAIKNNVLTEAIVYHNDYEKKVNKTLIDKINNVIKYPSVFVFHLLSEHFPRMTDDKYDKKFVEKIING